LGAAAAVFAADELGPRVAAYILECPFQDLRTAVRNRTAVYLPPVLDWIAATGLNVVAPLVIDDVDQISPLQAVSAIPANVPVLILAGGADRRARPEEARAIFARVENHGRLVIFDGASHLKLFNADPERYCKEFLGWVTQVKGAAAKHGSEADYDHSRRHKPGSVHP
jgi:pimeloyl-ACP methyl ester carboxylesterase